MRIAVGGIHTECSTSSPVLMHAEDFRVLRGPYLLAADYFSFLPEGQGIDLFALLHARAVPGGPVARETYETFKQEFLQRLSEALPLDGLYLAMHGAMKVDGMDDAEGDWIAAARTLVGPDCVVAASYDLHGNVTQRIIDQLDIFAAYRTAPHIDVRETMQRAWSMLLKSLESGVRPGVVWAPIPVLMPGERSSTEDEPARSLYAALPRHDQRAGIWDANIMVGYVWADEPRATACAVVTATNRDEAAKIAAELAEAYWQARADFRFGPVTGPLEDMLDLAEKAETRPVILADSGDNPTGGGVGDRADVLKALLARGFEGAVLGGITDRPAIEACFAAGEGAELKVKIGGSLDPKSPSIEATAKVVRLDDPGAASDRQAVIAIGGVTVILAAKRRPYHNIADFTRHGIDPKTVRLLVVKSGYLSPELQPIANPNLMALTDGVINQDIEALPNTRRRQPIYPFTRDFSFEPRPFASARWAEK
ncbi:M81 family metallopeptidase [Rhizobium paknamense]|uniref:M81 family metallopeptidase n=1 Tax=Rhizobium paknamense TaxID=1206817 RepID=UPI0027D7A020|nr:M81 family metallopeptidase [Rhizobium paknamense]